MPDPELPDAQFPDPRTARDDDEDATGAPGDKGGVSTPAPAEGDDEDREPGSPQG